MKYMKSWTYFLSLTSRDFHGMDMYNNYHLIILQKKPSKPLSPATDQFENPERDGKMQLMKMLPAYFSAATGS
jgi:hypothetical protein